MILIFVGIRLVLEIQITIQKIRIPPSGSKMAKKIWIPDLKSRIRPASSCTCMNPRARARVSTSA